jgi:hypothetical protein
MESSIFQSTVLRRPAAITNGSGIAGSALIAINTSMHTCHGEPVVTLAK